MTFKQGSPETKPHDNPEIKSNDDPEKLKQPYTRKHNNGHMLTAVLHQTGREQYIMAGRR